MASRSEREKSKMQEKYQMILSQMLKEEDNKYCVDCDTKSPRWASWNIGVFICIRCAGFHRNLGVHISKVKSVNLDSWTGEQIASVQAMGNSRARAVYEANLPDGFRRPQADSALESFIRAKYEQRKWIAKEWIPPEITVPIDLIESDTHQKPRVETTSDAERIQKNVPKLKPFVSPIVQPKSPPATPPIAEINTQNLLNLDEPSSHPTPAILNPMQELFQPTSVNKTEINTEIASINQELVSAFSSSNDLSSNTSGMMSNEKIMALFNTPQTSTMNIQVASNLSSPSFPYPPTQHSHPLAHQKSLSFGNNLNQQTVNFGSQSQIRFPSGINHSNTNGMSVPILQSPSPTFTPIQLSNQFSELMPFGNTKTNPSTSTVISNTPIQSVTERMPTSSDFIWQ